MSADVRKLLADAASTVDGVSCHPYFVQSTNAGTAYVRLERIDYPNRFGGVVTWNVVLLLPQDLSSAEKYLESKVPAIRDAIAEHLAVSSVAPQQLSIPTLGTLPCVFITGTREEG